MENNQYDEEVLVEQFENCTFPRHLWKHKEHLTVAYLYLNKYTFNDALNRLRDGVNKYNAAYGGERGYHETATQFWMRTLNFIIQVHGPSENSEFFFNYHSYLLNKMLPLLYYSYERFMSLEAKAEFLLPDLQPLPQKEQAKPDYKNLKPDLMPVPIPPEPFKAIEILDHAIEENPEHAHAYQRRGEVLLQLGEIELAEEDILAAIELSPEVGMSYFILGHIHAIKGSVKETIDSINKSFELGCPWKNTKGMFLDRPHFNTIREDSLFQEFASHLRNS